MSLFTNDEINDNELLDFLIEGYNKNLFNFLTKDNFNDDFINNLKKLKTSGFKYETESREIILKLWKYLIGRSIIFLKKKDKREAYHDEADFGVNDLKKYFEQFYKFEQILYGTAKYYRDHSFHVFRVFLLGFYIIFKETEFKELFIFDLSILKENKSSDSGNTNINPYDFDTDRMKEDNNSDIKNNLIITPAEFEAMWCIISLTHDLGYPLEKISEINSTIKEMISYFGKMKLEEFTFGFPIQFQFINDFILRFISSRLLTKSSTERKYVTHLQSKYYLKFSKGLEKFDHGIISCIILMKNLVYFLESDYLLDTHKNLNYEDARNFIIRREILRAMASHNCEDIYHYKIKTFGFLLLIFDELQDWSRFILQETGKVDHNLWKVKIKEFNIKKGNIEFETTISEMDFSDFVNEYAKFFCIKGTKFYKILRCAVITLRTEKTVSKSEFFFQFDYSLIEDTKKTKLEIRIHGEDKKGELKTQELRIEDFIVEEIKEKIFELFD